MINNRLMYDQTWLRSCHWRSVWLVQLHRLYAFHRGDQVQRLIHWPCGRWSGRQSAGRCSISTDRGLQGEPLRAPLLCGEHNAGGWLEEVQGILCLSHLLSCSWASSLHLYPPPPPHTHTLHPWPQFCKIIILEYYVIYIFSHPQRVTRTTI